MELQYLGSKWLFSSRSVFIFNLFCPSKDGGAHLGHSAPTQVYPGNASANKWSREVSLRPLTFSNYCSNAVLSNASTGLTVRFLGGEHRGFLKEGVKAYRMAQMPPLNSPFFFFICAGIVVLASAAPPKLLLGRSYPADARRSEQMSPDYAPRHSLCGMSKRISC